MVRQAYPTFTVHLQTDYGNKMQFGGTGFQPVLAQAESLRLHFYRSGFAHDCKNPTGHV
jgi:hypothetical protein